MPKSIRLVEETHAPLKATFQIKEKKFPRELKEVREGDGEYVR
jgi:hypothetical protein